MEEKKQIKISLKTLIILLVISLALISIIVFLILNNNRNNLKNDNLISTNSKDYKEVSIDGKIYYQRLNNNTWKGQYHQDSFYTENSCLFFIAN